MEEKSPDELNMTADEVDRLRKAFKDEKFRDLLREYAEEISDPENRMRYEEEIRLMEQERGNSIEFIHPEPFRALKTSVNGKNKCFINICASDKVAKPESKCGVSEDGRRGQCWSLPHCLHPGRQDIDKKGNKVVIYDVIFHPDTLHIASKNKRFMDMVVNTATNAIESSSGVTLDKNNTRQMNTKYKGTPQACVVRKPIPGYTASEASEEPDPLAFPYPDHKTPTTPSHTNTNHSPAVTNSFSVQSQKSMDPTKPHYTVKYRSFVDMQDFRYSRDSGRTPRPKEIVVTIDLPLLRSVTDASLEVTERSLLLESQKPAYRLELPLAYPVDEDKGQAQFNKQRQQLIVTLPVLPSSQVPDFAVAVSGSESEGDGEGEASECEEQETGSRTGEEKQSRLVEEIVNEKREDEEVEVEVKQQTMVEKDEAEAEEENMKTGQECVEEEQSVVGEEENVTGGEIEEVETIAEEETMKNQIEREHESVEEENVNETEDEEEDLTQQPTMENDEAEGGETGMKNGQEDASGKQSVDQEERVDIDEDDLETEQIFQTSMHDDKPPPAILTEIDCEGKEKVISDHSTSAGFVFQNNLMYELD